jgi:hypothetical protein
MRSFIDSKIYFPYNILLVLFAAIISIFIYLMMQATSKDNIQVKDILTESGV